MRARSHAHRHASLRVCSPSCAHGHERRGLAHASSRRENCAATYLSRPLYLRFYVRLMFCTKFASAARCGIARSLASRTYTFLLDSRRSSILDEADASREIIASILFESCVFRNMPDTLLLLREYRHSRRCLILNEQHRSIDPRYSNSDSYRYLIFLNFQFYYLTCLISILCLFISVGKFFFV